MITAEDLKTFDLTPELIAMAHEKAECKEETEVYTITTDSFTGTTQTIMFDETFEDEEFAEGLYEDEDDIDEAKVFYKTIEYWSDEKDFSKWYWMNAYGDILDGFDE